MTEDAHVTLPRFMAWDEGCIECGEPSGVVGFFDSDAEAWVAVAAAEKRQETKWRGQHHFFVVDLAKPEMSEHASPTTEDPR